MVHREPNNPSFATWAGKYIEQSVLLRKSSAVLYMEAKKPHKTHKFSILCFYGVKKRGQKGE